MDKLTAIKNIIFDLGGVIINVDHAYTLSAFSQLGIANPHEIFTLEQQGRLCDSLEVGKISAKEFCEALVKLSHESVSHEDIINAWNAMLLDIPEKRIEMLKRVRKKYRIYLLSNTNPIHMQYINNQMQKMHGISLESLFIKTYYSFELRLRKSDPRVFQHILDQNHLIPNETLLIDDLEANVLAAKDLGMQIWHVERNQFDGVSL